VPAVVDRVGSLGAALTSTVSTTSPTCSEKSMRACWPVRRSVLKPASFTSTV